MLTFVVSTSFFHFTMTRPLPLPLLASLAVNLALAAVLIGAWQAWPPAAPPVAAPVVAVTKTQAQDAQVSAFHWRQLDAQDLTTFARNLRRVGCPETTIHDIVAGELRGIYQTKQTEAARSHPGAKAGASVAEQREWQAAIKQWESEQAQVLATTLGTTVTSSSPAVATTTTATTAAQSTASPASNSAMQTPAAFLIGNAADRQATPGELSIATTDTRLNPATAAVIEQMRGDFATALQSKTQDQDPASPAYRLRWNQARRDSDERFSSLFGGDAFISTQLEAVRAPQ